MSAQPKVLFIDDEERVLKGIELNLGRKYNLTVASSGKDALELIAKGEAYSVVVVDYVMPEMNGAEFLKQMRLYNQSTVPILLTGATNFEYAADFVAKGGGFRLLSKPCPPSELIEHIEDALFHFQQVEDENHSIGNVMNAVVRSFTAVLAAALPLYFGRSQRVMRMASEIGRYLRLKSHWRSDPACVFSHLGFATLPPEVQLRAYQNEGVKPNEMQLIDGFENFTRELLYSIPNMSEVTKVVDLIGQDYEESSQNDNDTAKLASVIRIAKHYDFYASKGQNRPQIFDSLINNKSIYYMDALDALSTIRPYGNGGPQCILLNTKELKKGMRLQEDLFLDTGVLFAPKGSIVNPPLLHVMKNYRACYIKDPFPQSILVTQGSSFETD